MCIRRSGKSDHTMVYQSNRFNTLNHFILKTLKTLDLKPLDCSTII